MTGVQTCALRSEEHTSELQSHDNVVCRLLLEKNNDVGYPRNRPQPCVTDAGVLALGHGAVEWAKELGVNASGMGKWEGCVGATSCFLNGRAAPISSPLPPPAVLPL